MILVPGVGGNGGAMGAAGAKRARPRRPRRPAPRTRLCGRRAAPVPRGTRARSRSGDARAPPAGRRNRTRLRRIEHAGNLDAARRAQRRRVRGLELDLDPVAGRLDAADARPERFVRVLGLDPVEQCADLARAALAEGRGRGGLVEIVEVADHGPLVVVRLDLARPVLLQEDAEVARLPAALGDRLGAPRVERAAQRRLGRVGDLAARQVARHLLVGVGLGDRLEERLGVGVPRVGEDLVGGPDLHDPAEVHDRDAVAEVLRGRQVVGDVDVGEAEVAA